MVEEIHLLGKDTVLLYDKGAASRLDSVSPYFSAMACYKMS